MKKVISILMMLALVFGMSVYSYADEEEMLLIAPAPENDIIRVQQNGEYINFTDAEGNVVNPQIINNRTMVPFRKIFNALGVINDNITWDGETKTVTAKNDTVTIELQIDNTKARKTISGETTEINLDTAPTIVEGRTLVPVRFIAESMDKKVGWDAENRVVIIIDTQELKEDLMNAIPQYFRLLEEESQLPKTYEMKSNIKGKIEYTSKENREDNSTLNVTGTINTILEENALAIDVSLKFTGKGEIYNVLKENQFTTFTLQMIVSDNKIYIKSPIFDLQTKGKWMTYEDDSIKEIFLNKNITSNPFDRLFDIEESMMNTETYQSLKVISEVIKALLKDDNIQITEKGKTKTYSFTMKLSDITPLLKKMDIDSELWDHYDGSFKATTTLKDGEIQSNGGELQFGYTEGTETLKLELKIDGKTTKMTKISIPSDSQIVSADTIE